jgi:hypothetical protein
LLGVLGKERRSGKVSIYVDVDINICCWRLLILFEVSVTFGLIALLLLLTFRLTLLLSLELMLLLLTVHLKLFSVLLDYFLINFVAEITTLGKSIQLRLEFLNEIRKLRFDSNLKRFLYHVVPVLVE